LPLCEAPQENQTQTAMAEEQVPHLQNLLSLSKLQDFDEMEQITFLELGDLRRPSTHVLTPMGPKSPRQTTTQFGAAS